ncbi:MAG TPA: nuclear transport factor 2 family protein [Chitinophagaceae bacterium]|nr:nuclear transport factor 2 family protein [Chitinophagaceae bacterium]
MNNNEELIQTFYDAFARLDYTTMQNCYATNPVFNDPVFGILQGNEVKAMWEMLCKGATDLKIEYNMIEVDGDYTTCNWCATYTFSKTKRKVVNKIKAHMRMENGKITEHTDEFDIYKWSRQALGLPGILLGWSGYLKNKIRYNAKTSLQKFMQQ